MPNFHYNLLSVPRWTNDTGGNVSFTADTCIFQAQTSLQSLATGKLQSGLYHLELLSVVSASSNAALSKRQLSALWHMRMGHVSTPVFLHIPTIATHVNEECNKTCPICPVSKQSKLSFSESSSRALNIFELIHVDLWGPYAHDTCDGCKYFLTIVDDCSRAVWTFILPTKQHVGSQIATFLLYVKNHFNTSVKTFRCDHGSEFVNKFVVDLLCSHGISQQLSCVATPAQNGRVERKHRQLLSIARALRFQSGLPIRFWGECILTATFLINRLPTPVI